MTVTIAGDAEFGKTCTGNELVCHTAGGISLVLRLLFEFC